MIPSKYIIFFRRRSALDFHVKRNNKYLKFRTTALVSFRLSAETKCLIFLVFSFLMPKEVSKFECQLWYGQ